MENLVNKIDYNNKTIYYVDYRGLCGETLKSKVVNIVQALKNEAGKQKEELLILDDLTKTCSTSIFINESKKAEKRIPKKIKKEAIFGVLGFKKVILNIFSNKNKKAFTTMRKALEWLTEE
jgi:hypothetical protein